MAVHQCGRNIGKRKSIFHPTTALDAGFGAEGRGGGWMKGVASGVDAL